MNSQRQRQRRLHDANPQRIPTELPKQDRWNAMTSAPMAADGGACYRTFRAPGRGGLGIDPRKTALLFIEMQNEVRLRA